MCDEHRIVDDSAQAEAFWEGHYGSRPESEWNGKPNAVLGEVAGSLAPGRALDLGCGEGGDAIWLAGLGWQVTAVDISATALDRAAAQAAKAGGTDRIDVQRHDLAQTLPDGPFDLISAQHLHTPVAFPRARVLHAAARSVAPGGLLLNVDHASVALWSWSQHPEQRFPTPAETLAEIDLSPEQWHTERLAAPSREAIGPNGETATVVDNVIAVRRRTR